MRKYEKRTELRRELLKIFGRCAVGTPIAVGRTGRREYAGRFATGIDILSPVLDAIRK